MSVCLVFGSVGLGGSHVSFSRPVYSSCWCLLHKSTMFNVVSDDRLVSQLLQQPRVVHETSDPLFFPLSWPYKLCGHLMSEVVDLFLFHTETFYSTSIHLLTSMSLSEVWDCGVPGWYEYFFLSGDKKSIRGSMEMVLLHLHISNLIVHQFNFFDVPLHGYQILQSKDALSVSVYTK